MRPKSYLEEAITHVKKLNATSFSYRNAEEGTTEFRELVFSIATFAVHQSISDGRTFLKDPETTKVIGELLDYNYETTAMHERTQGQS